MLIDMHAHVVPDGLPAGPGDRWPRVEEADGARALVSGQMRLPLQEAWFDAERRLAAMDANGVDAEVVSPLPPLLNYRVPPADAVRLCRGVNAFIARLCEVSPSRFYGLGTVPMQDPDLAAAELTEVRAMGLHGIEIGSNVCGTSLGDDRFLSFFQEAARLGVPVFVHSLDPTIADRLPPAAMAGFGFAAEVSIAAASLVASGTIERCPDLRLAFSHGAGGFPLMLTRAQWFHTGAWNEEPASGPPPGPPGAARLPCSPSEYARRFWYDTLVFDRRALRYLVDMLGPRQLLIGTDFPAMAREQPAGRTLRELGLPADVLEDVTWHNCFRFLGTAPR